MGVVFSWFNALHSRTISRLEGHKGYSVSYKAVVRNIYVDIIKQCLLTLKEEFNSLRIFNSKKEYGISVLWYFMNTNMTLN